LPLSASRRHPDTVARLAQTAFEHIPDPKVAPNLLQIDRPALVGEARVARDGEQRGVARQRGDDVLGDAVSEKFLLGVAAHILERQHSNRGLVGNGKRGW
jgi:hypothetical protein